MRRINRFSIARFEILLLGLAVAPTSSALAVTNVSFQNGVNAYSGTFDRYISELGGANEVNGADVSSYLLSGYSQSPGTPDQQGLIRFDDIFGNGPGQIPLGAHILDASLELVTVGGPTATPVGATNGPYGVAGLLAPFDSSTSYFTDYPPADPNDPFGGRGAWWTEGHSTRPVGGFGAMGLGQIGAAPVTALVQQWSDGTLANHGMAVQAGFEGTNNDWGVFTTGYAVPQGRPKLNVTYTIDPIQTSTYQSGVAGYEGVTMARVVASGPIEGESTIDGSTLSTGFLDGVDASTAEQLALIKFDDVFGNGAGQAPLDKPVAKSWLVLTTGNGGSSRSPVAFDVHVMNRPWDTTTLHSSFGSTPGLQFHDGDISGKIDRHIGSVNGNEAWLDITSYLEDVRNGAPDHGLAIIPRGTDGWTINFTGAENEQLRPRLVVASNLSESVQGDFNSNGTVDAADYVLWRKGVGVASTPENYNLWRANFGSTGGTPQAPQPATLVEYDVAGVPVTAIALREPTAGTEGVTGLDLTRGPGINAAGLTNGFSANNWTPGADNPSRSVAIANGDYFQFGLSVDPDHTASLATLDLSLRRSATNGPMNYELQASLDGFATEGILVSEFTYLGRTSGGNSPDPNPILTDPFYYMTNDLAARPNAVTSPGDAIPTIDLSTIGALQDLAAGATVTFRLFAWGNANTAITNTVALGRMDGPKITGLVTSLSGSGQSIGVPEPASAVLALMLAAAWFGCGRRGG
jgi:hypothetical protein